MDFATATFVVIAKYISDKLNADTNRNDGWVIRSIFAIANAGSSNPVIADLAAKIADWKACKSEYHHPLSLPQFTLAKNLALRNLTTLAKLAKSNACRTADVPVAEDIVPTALASVSKPAAKKPARKKVKRAKPCMMTPDVEGLAPWEYDDRQFEGAGLPEMAVEF